MFTLKASGDPSVILMYIFIQKGKPQQLTLPDTDVMLIATFHSQFSGILPLAPICFHLILFCFSGLVQRTAKRQRCRDDGLYIPSTGLHSQLVHVLNYNPEEL